MSLTSKQRPGASDRLCFLRGDLPRQGLHSPSVIPAPLPYSANTSTVVQILHIPTSQSHPSASKSATHQQQDRLLLDNTLRSCRLTFQCCVPAWQPQLCWPPPWPEAAASCPLPAAALCDPACPCPASAQHHNQNPAEQQPELLLSRLSSCNPCSETPHVHTSTTQHGRELHNVKMHSFSLS